MLNKLKQLIAQGLTMFVTKIEQVKCFELRLETADMSFITFPCRELNPGLLGESQVS
jgi:hypothetical protein